MKCKKCNKKIDTCEECGHKFRAGENIVCDIDYGYHFDELCAYKYYLGDFTFVTAIDNGV